MRVTEDKTKAHALWALSFTVKTAPYFVTRLLRRSALAAVFSNAVWAKTSPRLTSRARVRVPRRRPLVSLYVQTSVFNDHQESYRLQCHTAGSSITYQKVQNALCNPSRSFVNKG